QEYATGNRRQAEPDHQRVHARARHEENGRRRGPGTGQRDSRRIQGIPERRNRQMAAAGGTHRRQTGLIMATDNPFKQAIQAGQRQIGLWVSMANPYTAEMCAACGFDWLLLDGEHSPNDLSSLLGQLQAIAASSSAAVVRPVAGETWMIKQLLDMGATNLLVPMVDTAKQARELVRAVRYPPQGVRGVGSRLARVSGFGAEADYLAKANERVCLLVQVETEEGLRNLDEIAAVEGVDGVFIGPSYLSAAMGHLGQPGHP